MTENKEILIVDDDPNTARTLVDILSIKGFNALKSSTPEETLALIAKKEPYCVISDIRMPGMNGIELFDILQEKHPQIPIILMSAYTVEDLLSERVNQGVVAVLSKPLDIDLLLMFLNALE